MHFTAIALSQTILCFICARGVDKNATGCKITRYRRMDSLIKIQVCIRRMRPGTGPPQAGRAAPHSCGTAAAIELWTSGGLLLKPHACSAWAAFPGYHKQYYKIYATIPPGNCQFQRKKILYDLFGVLLCILSSYLYIFLMETSNIARFWQLYSLIQRRAFSICLYK